MFAVMEVAAATAVSIRRHRYTTVSLDDLVDLGTMSPVMARLLRGRGPRPRSTSCAPAA